MNVAEVGGRIRQRREQVGLRQRDLAEALQLSAQAVSKWERGENAPDIGVLPDLARLLGISTDWLLAGFDDSPDLLRVLERIAMGDTTTMPSIPTIGPIDETDRLLTRLRDLVRMRNLFGQQVPTAVVDAVLRGEVDLAGARTEDTVMVTDVRGYTVLAETLGPRPTIALLNRYLEAMLAATEEFKGTLVKVMGDGLLLHFNLPLPQADHPLLAVQTALRMRERLVAFNQDQAARGEPAIRIGAGIHTGLVLAGTIGAEGRHTEYTILGETVNLASRIESATKEVGTDILISGATYDRVRDVVAVTPANEVTVKGISGPVKVYGVLGMK